MTVIRFIRLFFTLHSSHEPKASKLSLATEVWTCNIGSFGVFPCHWSAIRRYNLFDIRLADEFPIFIGSNPLTASSGSQSPSRHGYAEENDNNIGVLSTEPAVFFRTLQQAIDDDDPFHRCQLYGFAYNATHPQKRRIFYGTLIASESWEVFELVAAEAYGIFAGMVLVESNRTQNFSPRSLNRLHHAQTFRNLFGVDKVIIREFVDENKTLKFLDREHAQRSEILRGWKDMGMNVDDVGYLADADETFSRDFMRAVQTCEIDLLDYSQSNCRPLASGIAGVSQIYEEMSPECITTDKRVWKHPDLIIGHCIEGIGDDGRNPIAQRQTTRFNTFLREDQDDRKSQQYPLFNAADFRTIGGRTVELASDANEEFERFTGYHFHNFVTDVQNLRHKYRTYAHPDRDATRKPLEDIHEDLALVIVCVNHMSHHPKAMYERVSGGYEALKPRFRPIYFADAEYRQKRHALVSSLLVADERDFASMANESFVEEPADDDSMVALDATLADLLGTHDDDNSEETESTNPL